MSLRQPLLLCAAQREVIDSNSAAARRVRSSG
jgi:hypothetical protein